MATDRYGPPPASAGGGGYTQSNTQGPSSTTSSTTGGSNESGSYNKSWNEVINEMKKTQDREVTTVNTMNMGQEEYGMLLAYLREQMSGGSAEDQARRLKIWEEIAAGQTQRAQYSKAAAFSDSAAAASAMMSEALETALPALAAGVDAAGTSGSAMAALLSNKAAEAVSRNAAGLQLDAAISYGQIANQSSGIIAELLKIQSAESESLLRGLEIAKGVKTSQTTVRDRTILESSSSTRKGSEAGSSRSSGSNWSNTVQNNSGNTTTTVHTPTGGGGGGGGGGGYSNVSTPGSYRQGNR